MGFRIFMDILESLGCLACIVGSIWVFTSAGALVQAWVHGG
jgi:hypothetical protein